MAGEAFKALLDAMMPKKRIGTPLVPPKKRLAQPAQQRAPLKVLLPKLDPVAEDEGPTLEEEVERKRALTEAGFEARAPQREYLEGQRTLEHKRGLERRKTLTPSAEAGIERGKALTELAREREGRLGEAAQTRQLAGEDKLADRRLAIFSQLEKAYPGASADQLHQMADELMEQQATPAGAGAEIRRRLGAEEAAAAQAEKDAEVKPLPSHEVDYTARTLMGLAAEDPQKFMQALYNLGKKQEANDPRAKQVAARILQLKAQFQPKVEAADRRRMKSLED